MPFEFKSGTSLKVTISKAVNREAARKTLERLFMTDKAVAAPIHAREKNFADKPKRRGGRIWTKRPNKVHPDIVQGKVATIKATPQVLKDLGSVADIVEVTKA